MNPSEGTDDKSASDASCLHVKTGTSTQRIQQAVNAAIQLQKANNLKAAQLKHAHTFTNPPQGRQ